MKKYIVNIYALLLAVLLGVGMSSCREDDFSIDSLDSRFYYDENGNLVVGVRLMVSEMKDASTRSLADSPDFRNLGVYLLVFEDGEGLVQFTRITPDEVNVATDSEHENDGLVEFKFTLEPTERPAVIHIIATAELEFGAQIAFGVEEQIVPTLYSHNGNESLWQRLDLGSHIPSQENIEPGNKEYVDGDEANAERIAKMLSHIPMVRNYCKVSVEFAEDFSRKDLKLTELYVVNTPDRGNVSPYRAIYTEDGREEDYFIRFYDEADGKYVGRSYRDITDNDKYVGRMPTGIRIINTLDKPDEIQTKSISPEGHPGPVYLYESPARVKSEQRTYAIVGIEGKWRADKAPYTSYYKIDIGNVPDLPENDYRIDVGLFEYYNMLRNFNFQIKIHSVTAEGYSSLQLAGQGAVFNNLSASVEAKSMKSISDGEDWIYVEKTSHVFTYNGEELKLLVQFREDINGANRLNNSVLKFACPQNSIYEMVGNPVVKGQYLEVTLRCIGNPGLELPSEEFYVYRGNKADPGQPKNYGLYRVVTLFMHDYWPYKNVDTFPGLWEDMNENPWDWGKNVQREIGQEVGSPLTLFFEIPGDLPMEIFPLNFVIESDRQNIQNAYQGNAVVRSVSAEESLFAQDPTTVGKPSTSRIQYVKTVTWFDYNNESWDSEYNGKKQTLIRCRFLTITDLKQDGIGGSGTSGSSVTTLRVKCDPLYFAFETVNGRKDYAEDTFARTTSTSDPSPRFWDFSSGIWDDVMLDMNKDGRNRYQDNDNNRSPIVDALYFVEGNTRTMTNKGAYDDNGNYERYVRCSNNGDTFRHKHTYDTSTERTIRVRVVSTDDAGNPVAPTVVLTEVKRGTANGQNITATRVENDEETLADGKKVFVFDVTVQKEVTELNVDIKPSSVPMRFYKIDFYPRWDAIPNPSQVPKRKWKHKTGG